MYVLLERRQEAGRRLRLATPGALTLRTRAVSSRGPPRSAPTNREWVSLIPNMVW